MGMWGSILPMARFLRTADPGVSLVLLVLLAGTKTTNTWGQLEGEKANSMFSSCCLQEKFLVRVPQTQLIFSKMGWASFKFHSKCN